MNSKTKIEWVKNPDGTQGYTWNPITGCLNHINGFCKGGNFPCYAYRLAHGRLKKRYLANRNTAPVVRNILLPNLGFVEMNSFYPRFWKNRFWDVCAKQTPSGIFVCDMGELFGDWIPFEWQDRIFDIIKTCPQHRFYLLTKQPQNLIKFSPFPDNCFVGVTATGYRAFNQALDGLKVIEAKVKYLSIEPLLEGIIFYPERLSYCGVNQIIIGAQTKPYKPPKIEWVEEIVRAADEASIPVFLKENLRGALSVKEPFHKRDKSWIDPKLYYYRQEMPG